MFARERTTARARVHLREEIKRQREYGCGRAAGSRCDMKRTELTLGIARKPLTSCLARDTERSGSVRNCDSIVNSAINQMMSL